MKHRFGLLLTTTLALLCFGGYAFASASDQTVMPADTHTPRVPGAIVINTEIDELNADGDCSLREAIQAANTDMSVDGCAAGNGADTITLPVGSYGLAITGSGEDDNATGDLDIIGPLTIEGSGSKSTIIDGNSIDRVFHIHVGTVVVLNGVSIINGKGPSGTEEGCGGDESDACPGAAGGGIYNAGILTLNRCTVESNRSGDGGNTNETGTNAGDGGAGGGIFNRESLTLTSSFILSNTAGDGGDGISVDLESEESTGGDGGNGGGIFNAGTLMVSDTTIHGNEAGAGRTSWNASGGEGGYGGGLYNTGILTGFRISLSANETGIHGKICSTSPSPIPCSYGTSGAGGGLYNLGRVTLNQSSVSENVTADINVRSSRGAPTGNGGGIFNAGELLLLASRVNGNRTGNGGDGSGSSHASGGSAGDGGGIYNCNLLTLTDTLVDSNAAGRGGDSIMTAPGRAGDGGGLFNDGNLSVNNSTINGNTTGRGGRTPLISHGGGGGGGLFNKGNVTVENSTIVFNLTGYSSIGLEGNGGGLANESGSFSLRNTIVASNGPSAESPNCAGTLTSHGYNLIQNQIGCTLTGDTTGNITDQLASVATLADNGGPTQTAALYAGSPAIDAGSCTTIDGSPIDTDQRGVVRPQGATCDIGAYEFSFTVHTIHLPHIKGAGCLSPPCYR